MTTKKKVIRLWGQENEPPSGQSWIRHCVIPTKNVSISCNSWNLCNFTLYLPKFGCHGNSLFSLENSDCIFEFADRENLFMQQKFSISCTELKSVQFWLIFVQIWLPWQFPLIPWKSSTFEFADPENHIIHVKSVSISCTEMKLCLFECVAYLYGRGI